MILYGAVLILLFALFCLARRKAMGISVYLYELGRKKGMFGRKQIQENMRLLRPGSGGRAEREGECLKQFYTGKIRLVIRMLLAGTIFSICLQLGSGMDGILEEGKYLVRNIYGVGEAETRLQAEVMGENGESIYQDFQLTVREQQYKAEQVRKMAEEAARDLPDAILGNNASLEEVRENLNLIGEMQGYPFRIEWETDDYSCIDPDGSVLNEEMGEEGKIICLTAILSYEGYREEHIFPVQVFPPAYSQEEKLRKKIYGLLLAKEGQSRYDRRMELPESVEGRKLLWKEAKEDSSGILFLLIGIGTAAVYFLKDKDLQEKVEERNRQMLLDYPQLVSRMTLYMGAGMTMRNVFRKIALDYQKERQEGGELHYAYEEMLVTCHELDGGISETAAYERFGKRCRTMQYMKLANLLVQNLKKGSGSILEALRQEAKNAFEDRRGMARQLGEEAGTKLLLPMMLMLGIVMALIIIPAYLSFSG